MYAKISYNARPEAVRAGTSILVGTDPRKINKHVNKALKAKSSSGRFAKNPFGDGMAAKRIVDVIRKGKCKEFK